ncbi:UNKNOWN [Stylonychia lemnae]|uniref:YCII-related domain-containing protein n=1 Tax=Stylonychia lemnae TaxID=5949 RepID=A0A078AXC3_STYLE|nr:UNKNOWN [Stylonychia lemnae]|eukprot:CDW87115.1 UNKNOWN [Stylonychia lemnae]
MSITKEVKIDFILILNAVPHRENHLKNLDSMKAQNQTKLISVPFFPFDGNTIFIETEGDEQYIEKFVKQDPYIKNNLVNKYEINEFDMTSHKRFDRISTEFLMRS